MSFLIKNIFLRTVIIRILYALITIMISATITFFLIRNMPGDIIYALASQLAEELRIPIDEARKIVMQLYYGIDINKPQWLQYLEYIENLFRGNLGYSTYFKRPVTQVIGRFLGWTVFTLSIGISLAFAIGILIGMVAGFRRGTKLDSLITATSSILTSIPGYIIALLLYLFLSARLGLFPAQGAFSPNVEPGFNLPFIADVFYHAALPIITYVLMTFSGWALLIRSNVAKILEEDFLKYAEARGLTKMRITTSYIGKNSILPLVPLLAIRIGGMVGGSALIESIFAYPGMGYYLSLALSIRDYGLLQGIFFIMTLLTIAGVLIVEIITPLLDPRIRKEVRG
mgnify:CR=1 FL=1